MMQYANNVQIQVDAPSGVARIRFTQSVPSTEGLPTCDTYQTADIVMPFGMATALISLLTKACTVNNGSEQG